MTKATTTTRLDLTTLMAHLGVNALKVSGDPGSSGPKEVESDIPDLAERLAAYTYAEVPEVVAQRSVTDEAERALESMRIVANGTTPMTVAQLTVAVRGIARVLVVLARLQLRRFDGTG